MIDEFQDIDGLQYELMDALCGYHKIFRRGRSRPDHLHLARRQCEISARFRRHPSRHEDRHDDGKLPFIPGDPRRRQYAHREEQHTHQKDLSPARPSGAPVLCHLAGSQEEEALWIAETAEKLHAEGVPFADMAILYRAHYVTRAIEAAFLQKRSPTPFTAASSFTAGRRSKTP